MELSQTQLASLLKRFPEFELSYETISHKKVSSKYDLCFAIPTGKKCFAWFTFHQDKDVCYLLDLNREKKIIRGTQITTTFDYSLSLGTIVYGTYIHEETTNKRWFAIEDIYYYKGIPIKKTNFNDKLDFFGELMINVEQNFNCKEEVVMVLPIIWQTELKDSMSEYPATIPESVNSTIYYPVHHIQYRSSTDVVPYLNVNISRKINLTSTDSKKKTHQFETTHFAMDYMKPQYKYPTVFQVAADIQFDIYHLFVYGKNNTPVYFDVAYIPNYKTSVFMNGLFRNIRENKNIDYIEESDDEEDFQNMKEDKYVDVEKILLIECVFHFKFKRWIPIKVVDNRSKIVHITKLIR